MRRPLKALFVEDRDDDAELLAAELRRSGFDLTWARCDTYPSLDAALTTAPDVVLCDYGLPGMDPVEVLSRVRATLFDVPIIVVSAVVDADVAPILFQHGATDLLHKDRLGRLGVAVTAAVAHREASVLARKTAERERTTAADLLSSLVDHAQAAVCITHLDGTPLVANAHYEELLQRIPPKHRARLRRLSAASLATATAARCEVRLGEGTFLALVYPVVDATADHVATGLILTDITEQKNTELELRAARTQLQDQARELRKRNAELVELDRLKTDLVSTVSHELRTPLTSILGYSELLSDSGTEDPGGSTQRMIEMISKNSQRLLHLIDNLLLLAQLDGATPSGNGPTPSRPVLIADVVEAVRSVILPSARAAGLELAVDLPAEASLVPGDRDQLERALLNLAANAVKFSKPGGLVTLRLIPGEGHIMIEVSDQGIGMSEQDLQRLGTRFFRSDSARIRQLPGTGLGVSVVCSIVSAHGGSVEFVSRPGEGTTARVRLPRAAPPPEAATATPAPVRSPRQPLAPRPASPSSPG